MSLDGVSHHQRALGIVREEIDLVSQQEEFVRLQLKLSHTRKVRNFRKAGPEPRMRRNCAA
jgi:hypothetical protein